MKIIYPRSCGVDVHKSFIVAVICISEAGTDMSQWSSHRKLVAWVGLAPGCNQSAALVYLKQKSYNSSEKNLRTHLKQNNLPFRKRCFIHFFRVKFIFSFNFYSDYLFPNYFR